MTSHPVESETGVIADAPNFSPHNPADLFPRIAFHVMQTNNSGGIAIDPLEPAQDVMRDYLEPWLLLKQISLQRLL